jgi:phosphoglycerate dehydrogenase-like enzyme
MKPGASFINTARGAVVNEADLIAVLREREDLFAVLDVTYPEPPAPDSPLFDLPNVLLTPHIAGSLNNECRRMGRTMVEELGRWLRGEPLRYRVGQDYARARA